MQHIKKMSFLLLIAGISFSFLGCKTGGSDGCGEAFSVIFNGNVTDAVGNPLQNVVVEAVVLDSSRGKIAETDVNGNYDFTWYRHASLGNVYLIFTKAGYNSYTSAAQRVGDNCTDVTLSTNTVLTQ